MSSSELEAPVTEGSAGALRGWSSLWADLLHTDMVLLARDRLSDDAPDLFARRALWEAAVVAYGRTAMSGRRQQQIGELVSSLGADAEKCHADVMAWRNQHAAHRVDLARETVDVRAVLDPAQRRVLRSAIRVSPVLGPEEEGSDLATRLQKHVKALRDLAWEQRIQPLEAKVIAECKGSIDALLGIGSPPATPPSKGFSIDISPSGPGQR
jgi:hypothetical protein